MIERRTLAMGLAAAKVRLLGQRVPLAARIQVAGACPCRCVYCEQPELDHGALSGAELLALLEELADLGCARVSFSGGEPMLRHDIGTLVDACAALGMAPEMNSCGVSFAEQAASVAKLRLLKLSLDGPPEVHDELCQREGSYRDVVASVQAAKDLGIRVVLVATITRRNVEHLDHVLERAEEWGVMAAFQPYKPYHPGGPTPTELLPEPGAMRAAIRRLLGAQRAGAAPHIRNSAVELRRLLCWPDYPPQRCWAGRIFCIIGVDGTLYPCDRTLIDTPLPSVRDGGLAQALARLSDVDCEGCGFCGAQELNLALSMDPRVLATLLRLVKR